MCLYGGRKGAYCLMTRSMGLSRTTFISGDHSRWSCEGVGSHLVLRDLILGLSVFFLFVCFFSVSFGHRLVIFKIGKTQISWAEI